MENHYPPVIEKSIKVINRFEEKFDWFVIRVYQFPLVEGFGTFLESVQRTLLKQSLTEQNPMDYPSHKL